MLSARFSSIHFPNIHPPSMLSMLEEMDMVDYEEGGDVCLVYVYDFTHARSALC